MSQPIDSDMSWASYNSENEETNASYSDEISEFDDIEDSTSGSESRSSSDSENKPILDPRSKRVWKKKKKTP